MAITSEELPAYLTSDDGSEQITRARNMTRQSSMSQRPLVELDNAAKTVYRNGDVLNQLKWKLLSRTPLVTASATAVAYGYSESGTPRLFAFGAIAAGTLIARRISILATRRSFYRKLRPTFDAFERLDKEFGIGRLEVYKARVPGSAWSSYPNPNVRWYPPDGLNEFEIVRHLERLAISLTAVTGSVLSPKIRRPRRKKIVRNTLLTIPKSLLDELGIEELSTTRSEKTWLRSSHPLPIIFRKTTGKEQLVTLNQSGVMWCLEDWRRRQKKINLTEHFVKLIAARNPRHPLVQAFYQKPQSDAQSREFTRATQRVLERRLHRGGSRLVSGAEHARDAREKVSLRGELRLKGKEAHIDWYAPEHKRLETTGLLAYFKLSNSSLINALTQPESLGTESVILACEIALWLHGNKALAFDLIEPTQINRFKHRNMDNQPTVPLQEQVVAKTLKGPMAKDPKYRNNTFRIRSSITSAIVIAAAVVVPGQILEAASHHYESHYAAARAELFTELKQQGLDDSVAQALASHLAEQKIQHSDPLTRASDFVHDAARELDALGGPPIADLIPSKLFADHKKVPPPVQRDMGEGNPDAGEGGVGDANPPHRPDWFVTSHGLVPSGYWPSRVYNSLVVSQSKNDAMYWLSNGQPGEQTKLPTRINQHADYLKVERVMTVDQLLASSKAENPEGDVFFTVPVEYGNQISVARLTTETGDILHLARATFSDGTQTLAISPKVLPTSGLIHMEYWLTRAYSLESQPHAVGPITETPNSRATARDQALVRAQLNSAEDKYFATHSFGSTDDTAERDRIFLADSTYKLAPIDAQHADVLSNPVSLAGYIIQNRDGNCNTNNTVMVTGNPKTLNLVTGYYNSGDLNGQSFLSASEDHAWATDSFGTIIDATPIHVSGSDSSSPDEDFKGMKPEFTIQKGPGHDYAKDLLLAIVGGATGLGVASFMTKRQRNERKKDRASRRLDRTKPKTIQATQQALNFAQFAPSVSTFELKPEISNPVTKLDLYNAAKEIVKNGAADQVLRRLKEMAKGKGKANTEAKAATRRAIKVLANTRKYLESTSALTGPNYADCEAPMFSKKITYPKWKKEKSFVMLSVNELGLSPKRMRSATAVMKHVLYGLKDEQTSADSPSFSTPPEIELMTVANAVLQNGERRQIIHKLWKAKQAANDVSDDIGKLACLDAIYILNKNRWLTCDPQTIRLARTSGNEPAFSR